MHFFYDNINGDNNIVYYFLVLQTVRVEFLCLELDGSQVKEQPDATAGCMGAFVRFSDNNPTAALLRAKTGWMAY